MTAYEKITSRIDNLDRAENNCHERGNLTMAWIWKMHRKCLVKMRDNMTTEKAGSLV